MSIVGPRPRGPHEIDRISEKDKNDILSVRPGMTGPWQVAAIGRKPREGARVKLDAHYVRSGITFKKDIGYILRTIPSFHRGHGKHPS